MSASDGENSQALYLTFKFIIPDLLHYILLYCI